MGRNCENVCGRQSGSEGQKNGQFLNYTSAVPEATEKSVSGQCTAFLFYCC